MKIVNEKPPVWEECNKRFKLVHGTVFTYGDTLFNPDGIEIPSDMLIHEKTHALQQEYSDTAAKIWWDRYFADPLFRLEQEVAAYSSQYRYICARVKDKNARDRNLRALAGMLASPVYGNAITEFGAREAIKRGSLT